MKFLIIVSQICCAFLCYVLIMTFFFNLVKSVSFCVGNISERAAFFLTVDFTCGIVTTMSTNSQPVFEQWLKIVVWLTVDVAYNRKSCSVCNAYKCCCDINVNASKWNTFLLYVYVFILWRIWGWVYRTAALSVLNRIILLTREWTCKWIRGHEHRQC
jgi:hypothetical protein